MNRIEKISIFSDRAKKLKDSAESTTGAKRARIERVMKMALSLGAIELGNLTFEAYRSKATYRKGGYTGGIIETHYGEKIIKGNEDITS